MIATFCYHTNQEFRSGIKHEEIPALRNDPKNLLWIDVYQPTEQELQFLQETFQMHPLAFQELKTNIQRARIEQFKDLYAITAYTVRERKHEKTPPDSYLTNPSNASVRKLDSFEDVEFIRVNLFIGKQFLMTVHNAGCPEIEQVMKRWEQNSARIGSDLGALTYSLLDQIIDDYLPVIDDMGDAIEELEDQIFEQQNDQLPLQSIFELKKDLLAFRRLAASMRDVINVLLRREQSLFPEQSGLYFQDVYENVLRLTEAVDTYRDLLTSALDASLSVTSNRLNVVVQALTSWSIILMASALVAGIYGMNFKHMPELNWRYGYFYALGLILTITGMLVLYFKRRKWL